MGLRSFGILCLLFGSILGCYQDESIDDLSEEVESADVDPEPEGPNFPEEVEDKPTQQQPESDYDEGFDPCPEVTYVLWEQDGVKVTVVIEVFCDPIQNMNLGCPGPSY